MTFWPYTLCFLQFLSCIFPLHCMITDQSISNKNGRPNAQDSNYCRVQEGQMYTTSFLYEERLFLCFKPIIFKSQWSNLTIAPRLTLTSTYLQWSIKYHYIHLCSFDQHEKRDIWNLTSGSMNLMKEKRNCPKTRETHGKMLTKGFSKLYFPQF